MLQKDTSRAAVMKEAEMCKRDTTLVGDNQMQDVSGHKSADYGSGPDKSAAVPSYPGFGGPKKGNSGNSKMSY